MMERPEKSQNVNNESSVSGLQIDRRTFIAGSATFFALLGATGAALTPLLEARQPPSGADIYQKHYKQLTEAEKLVIFKRLEQEVRMRLGAFTHITDPPPLTGRELVFVLDIDACTGCGQCISACMQENNCSRKPIVNHLEFIEVHTDSQKENAHWGHTPTHAGMGWTTHRLPIQCQQCRHPPCIEACPVKATWKEEDGLVVIDYNWCIGCRQCQSACPYGARKFNYAKPAISGKEINPEMSYLSNRLRPMGVMEKCTFCLQRIRNGLNPACQDGCPENARLFGDLSNPESAVHRLMAQNKLFVLAAHLGTSPRFYYTFSKKTHHQ